MDLGGDTDPATDVEEAAAVSSAKHKAKGSAAAPKYVLASRATPLSLTGAVRLKRSRAMDPFESSSMVHPGATGLADDWRTRLAPRHSTPSQSPSLDSRTLNRSVSSQSLMSSVSMVGISTPSPYGTPSQSPSLGFQTPSRNISLRSSTSSALMAGMSTPIPLSVHYCILCSLSTN